ncbi:DUF6519 domain-containing protein [Leptolyngbya sp. GGD]|uniref:DUF6519 domain-containing protein n=1 Tax=Leptolyngbya sp. GGD TaxID=2997907 RepID=UPI00227AEB74|nr:DUF6519 domain-containing protein [Leptolyngbya sp. GGD]MCY6493368.1 DUF6519 domain-containing protein [Leptolyngbya sp. GGD]
MKGDFSRFTFDSKNRYSRVLMQQGRVQLDADWNEQLDISAYRTETEITDFIGQSGAPEDNAGFAISVIDKGTNLKIGQGRFYIEGMLFENHSAEVDVTFTNQPDFPNAKIEDFLSKEEADGKYLVYLDVWQHHITSLEAPTIRDIALGGADTTTRVKNVWQVKFCKLEDKNTNTNKNKDKDTFNRSDYVSSDCQPEGEAAISEGKLTVKATSGAVTENQLYRVEIHQGNEGSKTKSTAKVSFKWSRDNGAIAAQVEASTDRDFIIKNAGRDAELAFPLGALVEFSNADLPLNGKPGILATVERVQGNRLTVGWKTPDTQPPENWSDLTIVRRWDCSQEIGIDESFNKPYELEQSITVQFESGKLYKTGDYWLIPSRALTESIEWSPEAQCAHGVQHYYCSLALLERKDGKFSVLADWRSLFKPITSGLLNKAGDTMTGDLTIDQSLYVARKVEIGGTAPEQKVVMTNGKVAIGYNDPSPTAALTINGSVGIGEIAPEQKLVVTGGKAAIGYNDKDQTAALAVNGDIGVGLTKPSAKLDVNGVLQVRGSNFRTAMEFTGTANSYIRLDVKSIPTGNEITICFWAKSNNPSNSQVTVIYALNASSQRVLNIHLPYEGQVYFDCGVGSNDFDRLNYPYPSDCRGKWTHWAFTKHAKNGTMKIYRDGTPLISSATGNNNPLSEVAAVMLGGSFASASSFTPLGLYVGLLANLRIWKIELSDAQVRAEMNGMLPNSPDLVASYLDVNKDRIVKDYSGNNHDGTAQSEVSTLLNELNQVMFGAGDTGMWRHLVRTRHSRKDNTENALDFYIWNTTQESQDLGRQHTLTLNGDGNVGIGTTNPKSRLSVGGGVAIGADYASGNASPTDGLIVKGNVGVGTNTPQAKLEVQGGGGQNIDLLVNGRLQSGNNDGGLMVGSDRFVGGHSTNKIGFYANKDWRLTVQSDGNVGIGTANPQAKLDVVGIIKAQGYATQIYTEAGIKAKETRLRNVPSDFPIRQVTLQSEQDKINGRGIWQLFPDLEKNLVLSADAAIVVFYQISMPGGGKYIVTRLKVNDDEVSRTICGDTNYWGVSDLWFGQLTKGSHRVRVEFRTSLPEIVNNPALDDPYGAVGEYAPQQGNYHNRRLQVLVFGA